MYHNATDRFRQRTRAARPGRVTPRTTQMILGTWSLVGVVALAGWSGSPTAGGRSACAAEPPATEPGSAGVTAVEPNEARVLAGRYAEVERGDTPRAKGLWAFARFQLVPGQEVLEVAREAQQGGDVLGTFVVLMCQRGGIAVRRDIAEVAALNYELRTRLEQKQDLTPLELYVLSQCHHGDRNGRTRNRDVNALFGEVNQHRAQSAKRLQEAAEQGVAQACTDLALAQENQAAALEWHERAAKLGSSTGKRYVGFFLVMGSEPMRDVARGLKLTREAAEHGDAFAMINMAVFHTRVPDVPRDAEQARQWIDRAAATGHWMGLLEKGAGQLLGAYGYEVDAKAGRLVWQQAARLGSGEVLSFIADAYADGFGVQVSGRRAVAFAEAAYVQGSPRAASRLAKIFEDGLDDVEPDAELAQFWKLAAALPGLQTRTGGGGMPENLERRLREIDPLTLTVD